MPANGKKSGASGTGGGSPGFPSKWWQYLLVYPTLIGSLLTAGPTWFDKIRSIALNVENRGAAEADLQSRLMRKNMACMSAPEDWYLNSSQVNVDATICASGDIYVRASAPGVLENMYFVPVERALGLADPSAPKAGQAQAAEYPPRVIPAVAIGPAATQTLMTPVYFQPRSVPVTVVCTKFRDNRYLLRHVRTTQACFDEIVDSLSGRTISRTQVPCRSTC